MPLHVYCPMGCVIRMPSNRAGRVVRCPQCHSAIRIPQMPETMLDLPNPIPCTAKMARRIRTESQSEISEQESPPPASSIPMDVPPPKQTAVNRPPEPQSDSGPEHLPVPEWVKPAAKHQPDSIDLTVTSNADALKESVNESLLGLAPTPTSIPMIDLTAFDSRAIPESEEKQWEERLQNANSDRRVLALFFAACLCLVAIVNIVPAIYHWYHWTQLAESMALPRWIYIQIFVGAIHLIYAVYLAQIPDWAALRAVSIAMLVVAFVFGFVSTGLLVGDGQGNLTGFLGIPFTLNRQACIWCVAMLCLATLMSYWGGKESSDWQRSEYLLREILKKSPA